MASLVIRGLLALLGLGLVGTGIAAIFTANSEAGAATLVGIGSLLVILGALGDRLESLRLADMEIKLRDQADKAAGRGDLEEARILDHAADIVGGRARKTARAYESVRSVMPAGLERTLKMGTITDEVREDVRALHIDDQVQEDVLRLLWTGSEGARVWALVILQEHPELATPRAVLDAVKHPDEMFDQFQALILARNFVRLQTTRQWQRERVAKVVSEQLESGKFGLGEDEPSIELAKGILEYVSGRPEPEDNHASLP